MIFPKSKYPYTNLHELNLDWIVDQIRKLTAKVDGVVDPHFQVVTLPAGSDATVEYDEATNTITLGIPRGDSGSVANLNVLAMTGEPGSAAQVNYNERTGVLTFTIPRGAAGAAGAQGPQGPAGPTGPQGPAGSLANFTTEAATLAPGSEASASYNPDTNTLTIGIPRGATGPQGAQGAQGAPGPQGPAGQDGSIGNLTVAATTLPAGSNATAQYNPSTSKITFGIPRGADGSGSTYQHRENISTTTNVSSMSYHMASDSQDLTVRYDVLMDGAGVTPVTVNIAFSDENGQPIMDPVPVVVRRESAYYQTMLVSAKMTGFYWHLEAIEFEQRAQQATNLYGPVAHDIFIHIGDTAKKIRNITLSCSIDMSVAYGWVFYQ